MCWPRRSTTPRRRAIRGLRERDQHALAPGERHIEDVAAAEIVHRDDLAAGGTGIIPDFQPDQVGMIELVLLAIVGQHRAVDEQLRAGERLGRIAVADALEAHHDNGVGRPYVGYLKGSSIPGVERPIIRQRHWLAGEGFHPEFALDAVRGADYGHLDGVLRLAHGRKSFVPALAPPRRHFNNGLFSAS